LKGKERNELFQGVTGAHRRAVYRAAGRTKEDLEKPLVGVVNTWSEVCPGHLHLRQLAELVKAGIWQAGGTPLEFGGLSQCATPALGLPQMRYDLPARDLLSYEIETIIETQMLQAMVVLVTCDKTIPGALLAAARLDIPAIIVPGGAMEVSTYDGQPFTLSDLDEKIFGTLLKEDIPAEEIEIMEERACPSCGACSIFGTANTMQCLSEVLGLSLPFSSTVKANSSEQLTLAKKAGNAVMNLVEKGMTAKSILSEKAIYNAIKILLGFGGSTNAIVHLLALIDELGLNDKYTLKTIDEISDNTPSVVDVAPTGKYYIPDFHEVGGVPALLNIFADELYLDVETATGGNLNNYIATAERKGRCNASRSYNPIIRNKDNPINQAGGLKILSGNLATEGAVSRQLDNTITYHQGPARVFTNQPAAVESIRKGKIKAGDVVVIKDVGPRGAPGMPDLYAVLASIVGMGLEEEVAVVTDGRFSGFARGLGVCQVSPEARRNGPLAAVENGDQITIDLEEKELSVDLTEEEISRRVATQPDKESYSGSGILSLYATNADSATRGAKLK